MCRYRFYILICLFTFGISSLITFQFYFQDKINETSEEIEEVSINLQEKIDTNSIKESEQIINPVCTDKVVLSLWNELKTDKKYEKRKEVFEDESNCLEKMFEVEAFDLNGDGKNEFLVRGDDIGFCGATGNCDFWIYRKISKKYQRILTGYSYLDGRDILSQIKKSKTNKFKDILLEVRIQRNAHAYRLYKFDGKIYKEKSCNINQWNELNPEEKTKIISCRKFERKNYKLDFE
jgi:hypothetical protein